MATARAAGEQVSSGLTDGVSKLTAAQPIAPEQLLASEKLKAHIAQSEARGDAIGGRKWSRLQTVAFVVLSSAALWIAIGCTAFWLLKR